MPFFFTRAFWRQVRFTGLIALLLACLGFQRCQDERLAAPAVCVAFQARPVAYWPAGDTSTSAQPSLDRKANPRSRWHSVPGPAYLVYPLPRPPKQAVLDGAAAKAAQLHKI